MGWPKGKPAATRGKRYPPEPLSAEEARRLIRAFSRRAPTAVRNAAVVTLVYRSGLRISEALSLRPKDIEAQAGIIRVLHGKGDRSRTSAIDPETQAMVERWLDHRRQLRPRPPRGAPLFCTLQGGRVSPSYFRQLLPRIARRAGIEKRVHMHGLRHTFAAELAREGYPMNQIQAALGHTSLSTTSRYLAHVAPQDVIKMLRERAWQAEPLCRRRGKARKTQKEEK